ncbi:MAG: Ig-like domain-containing protein [Candidatus Hydrogenedentales bacterium]
MIGEPKVKPGFVIVAAVGFTVAVVAPVWAFFNVTVPFPPMLADDQGVTTVNTPVNINLVANDADADGRLDTSTLKVLQQPAHGIVTVNPETGACTYAPELGYTGQEKFSYQLCDDEGVRSNVGFVTVVVQPQSQGTQTSKE